MGQAAARQAAVDFRHAERDYRQASAATMTVHAGKLVANLLDCGRVKHTRSNNAVCVSSQYVLFPNLKAYIVFFL